jgi:hypothetical protein
MAWRSAAWWWRESAVEIMHLRIMHEVKSMGEERR